MGIVRVSGPQARSIGESLTGKRLLPRRASVRRIRDLRGETIDTGVVLFFAGPESFTGEDVVELQGHGGPVVLGMIVDQVLAAGARLARAGEFTERAYLNGKLDLAQAEAVADLIAGGSEAAVRGANRSLAGEFSRRVHGIDALVLELRLFVEAAIDFPEEDVDLLSGGEVAGRLESIRQDLQTLIGDCAHGVVLRDGIKLALIGAPNVGKSSLLNRLAGESRAIVTDIPGTTRDLVRADLVLDGLPVELVDTAGLRDARDAVEAEGVRRALAEAAEADIVVLVRALDGSPGRAVTSPGALVLPPGVDPDRTINVLNKRDLVAEADRLDEARAEGYVVVSALTGDGIDQLRREIGARAGYTATSGAFTARRRHLTALETAASGLAAALTLAGDGLPGELIAEELKGVHRALGEIVGETTTDDLLGEIFSRFCIGK